MIVDVSAGKQNYSQRNNKISPSGSCATTSIMMAMDYSGFEIPKSRFDQPEDGLIDFIRNDPETQEYYRKRYPTLYEDKIPANEIHAVNAVGVNRYWGRTVIAFTDNATVSEILFRTLIGRAVPVSGVWSGLNHVVCVVGFDTAQEDLYLCGGPGGIDTKKIKAVLIDDPYGDYRTGYKVQSGNNIEVPFYEFVANTKSRGSLIGKWAYWLTLGR